MTTHVDLANQLCFSVYNVNRLFNKFYQEALKEFDLTYPQYLLLTVLWNHDHRELHELGDTLHLSSNTLSPLIKRLEAHGWVTRQHPAADKRRLIVSLTAHAKAQETLIQQALGECLGRYSLTEADYEQALALNQKLEAGLN